MFCLTPGHDVHDFTLGSALRDVWGLYDVLRIELRELHARLPTRYTIYTSSLQSQLFKGKDNTMHLWLLESKKTLSRRCPTTHKSNRAVSRGDHYKDHSNPHISVVKNESPSLIFRQDKGFHTSSLNHNILAEAERLYHPSKGTHMSLPWSAKNSVNSSGNIMDLTQALGI